MRVPISSFALVALSLATAMSSVVATAPGDWEPAKASDSRSPCPVLNTLANHGHLPRDGLNITAALLNSTLQSVLNFEPALSGVMSAQVSRIADSEGKLTLGDLALHNFIEHDASLVHDDVLPGQTLAPTNVNQTKLAKLLTYANANGEFTFVEFSRARADAEIALSNIGPNVTQLGAFEVGLVLQSFGSGSGTNFILPVTSVATLFGEEKLPSGFVKQAQPPTQAAFFGFGSFIVARVNELKALAV